MREALVVVELAVADDKGGKAGMVACVVEVRFVVDFSIVVDDVGAGSLCDTTHKQTVVW